MAQYNPPYYTWSSDPITLQPAPGQSIADMEGDKGQTPVSALEYYAPDVWCETFVEELTGDVLYKLKPGYLTPDGLLRYKLGYHSTAPHPDQLQPVDLTQFRVIQPAWKNSNSAINIGNGRGRPLWYSEYEEDGGDLANVPIAWLSETLWQDVMTAMDVTQLKEGYLTPGLMDLYMANSGRTIEPPVPTRSGRTYTLPAVDGVSWVVDGEPAEPGTYQVEESAETVTVEISPIAGDGVTFDPPATQTVFTFEPAGTDPDPDPDPDPPAGDDGTEAAVALMSRMLGSGASDDEMSAAYGIVRLFVQEYTRGKGFDTAGKPKPGLLAVIVSGAVRLVTNPEQAELYVLDGVTIRPAVFRGYTLAEQKVLNNYRKRFA